MTWMRALPIIAVCFVFDALRFFFGLFWFFGPALAAVYCTSEVSSILESSTFGLLGAKTSAVACSAVIGVAGYLGEPIFAAFGIIMAMVIGLFGWLTVGLALMLTNARIFKEHDNHALKLVVSLFISQVPIINSLPALTGTMVHMYHSQIKKDGESLQKYKKENADAQLQERRQRALQLMQARSAHIAESEAADTERYNEATRDEEIPDEVRRAV